MIKKISGHFIAESRQFGKFEITTNQITMSNLQQLTEEIWKDIPGFENFYQVSDTGNIKRYPTLIKCSKGFNNFQLHQGGLCHPTLEKSGYKAISLYKNGFHKRFRVHTLVGLNFVANPYGYKELNHINGIKDDNRSVNLEWCTRSRNCKHMYEIGLAVPTRYYGLKNDPLRSTSIDQFDINGNFIKNWPSSAELKREFGYHQSNIFNCINGKFKQAYGYIWKRNIHSLN